MTNKNQKKRTSRHPIVRFLKHKVLHVEDSPHKIALGVAIGIFIVPNPLFGLHIAIVLGLCFLLKANKIAAIASTFVNNIFTLVLIYYPTYLLGWAVCSIFFERPTLLNRTQIVELFSPGNFVSGLFRKEYWMQFWELMKQIGPELWIGSFVAGGIGAIVSYLVCLYIVRGHRAKSPHRRYAKYRQ
ncbi:MAG: DUF2062 domain-containing protein [Anaerohalosphaeraceae bacterium]|nr:DUF2062 domain-containing protein [Anaerohalosphaeraceae bacterium]